MFYDQKGRLIRLTDWDGNVTGFTYDKADRHVRTQRSNTLDSLYQHDAAGRLRSLHHLVGAASIRQSFLYAVDSRGNRTQAQEVTPRTSGATATTMDHNYAGLVYRGDWDAVGSYHEANAHDAAVSMLFYGDTATLTMGSGDDHSIFDVYIDGTLWQSFDGWSDPASDLDSIVINVEGTGLHQIEIKNRLEHRIGSSGYKLRFKSLHAQPAFDVTEIDYGYDSLSRLLTANYDGGAVEYTYGYDVAGNLIDNNGTTRTYNAANQMVDDGTNTLTYDANGNLTNDGVNAYTWDRANRMLTAPGSTSYVYDGAGNRIQQTVSSVVTDYLLDVQPGLAVVLRQDDGTDVDHFVHSRRGIHAAYDGTNWEYAVQDGLRSVRGWADSNADVNNPVSFDPYGEPDTSVDGFAFTGEMRDGNGLQYHRARYYKPGAGVWTAQDFLETANRYAYVSGNPVNLIDPTGLICEGLTGTAWYYCRRYMECPTEDASQSGRFTPYRIPSSVPVNMRPPADVLKEYKRLCEELCNPDHPDNIYNKVSRDCRQGAADTCHDLCNYEPRALNDDFDHNGVLVRWIHYWLDLNNARPSHKHAYEEVMQRRLRERMDNLETGWNSALNGCREGKLHKSVAEFDKIAQKWRHKPLQVPLIIAPEPDDVPYPTFPRPEGLSPGQAGVVIAVYGLTAATVAIGGTVIGGSGTGSGTGINAVMDPHEPGTR